nr:MAG TPA: outer membrane protein assembly factor [Caudoviricetes sp.]
MIKKLILTSCIILGLSGCATQTKIQKVEVPVYSCPSPILPTKPDLSIYKINEKTTDQEVLRLYGHTVDQLLIYTDSLYKQLENYKSVK